MEIVSSLGNVTAELDQFLFFYPSCDFFFLFRGWCVVEERTPYHVAFSHCVMFEIHKHNLGCYAEELVVVLTLVRGVHVSFLQV